VGADGQASASLASAIKAQAGRLGFELAGIAALGPSAHGVFYQKWLQEKRHGEMGYLERPDAVARRLNPQVELPALKSAIVVGLNYAGVGADSGAGVGADAGAGIIARYARGRDYHKVIKRKLLKLLQGIEETVGHPLPGARACVDTAPVLERELAQRAGLGWFGRNTMLINPRRGSYFFLGVLLTELELPADAPFEADHCGSCNACVQSCPTGALLGRDAQGAPVIDATRCISYLTIEQRGAIPRDLRPLIGNRIFGCDICQEVCPWNSPKFVPLTRDPEFGTSAPANGNKSLIELMGMDEAAWDEFSRGTAMRRARRTGFLRNVAVALGNWAAPEAVPVLSGALNDAEPLVRGHAAWALGRIGTADALAALRKAELEERNAWVRNELSSALAKFPDLR